MKLSIIFSIILSIPILLSGQAELITGDKPLTQLRSKFKDIKYYKPAPKLESIFDRYINGESNLLDSINSIFRSNNTELKTSLLENMLRKPYDFRFPTELQKVIINNFSIDEINFIWVVGRFKFDGYVEFFENQIHKIEIQQQANLLFWLAKDGSSTIGFQLLKKLLTSKNVDFYDNRRLFDALYSYMYSNDLTIKGDAIELAIEIYYSKAIYKHFLEYGEYEAKEFENQHLNELLLAGDPKIIELAKSLYKRNQNEETALSALLRNDCKGYKEELINRIINDGQYEYVGKNASIQYLKTCSDYSIIPLITEKYFKYKIRDCVDFFESNHLLKELDESLYLIQDENVIQNLRNEIFIRNKTARDVVLDLFKIGVISELDTANYINKVLDFQNSNKTEFRGNITRISPHSYFLNNSPVNTRFDYESNEFPILYDEIFYNALNLSIKELGTPKIYSLVQTADDMSNANHEIFIDFLNFGIITKHTSNSLYPDADFIINTLNLCNSLSKTSKKFYHNLISASNVVFYTNENTFLNYSEYLKNGRY